MITQTIYDGNYQWIIMGRDPDKPNQIIDTNQYIVKDGDRTILLDPGGMEIFSSVLAATLSVAKLENITDLFASHQDPDTISSLGLWHEMIPDITLHAPALWEGFIRHFSSGDVNYQAIDDKGGSIRLESVELQFIPAHYLHSSANFNVYDPNAKILMSGDIGAALEAPGAPMFVDDFESHKDKMHYFHKRWMSSNEAKKDWVRRVRELDIEIMAPQHGRMFKGDDVKRFLDWFESLDVGVAIHGG
ncbi:MAG: MBL fold metallo-hydrolase [Gammaproteobacteria bacterium]|nr:MBL fold metallo-hydrolase [Gammaproteobacteria bacterium]